MDKKENLFLLVAIPISVGIMVPSISLFAPEKGLSFALFYGVSSGFIVALVLYAVLYGKDRFVLIRNKLFTPVSREINLKPLPVRHNLIHLKVKFSDWRIENLFVDRVQIRVLPNGDWITDSFVRLVIESNKSAEIPFIKWHPKSGYFVLPDSSRPNGKPEEFRFGDYEFQVAVIYGYESWQGGQIKRFRVPVSYEAKRGIKIGKIEHDDSIVGE